MNFGLCPLHPYLRSLSYLRGSEQRINIKKMVRFISKLPTRQWTMPQECKNLLEISKLPTRQWTPLGVYVKDFEFSKLPTRQWTSYPRINRFHTFSKLPTRQWTCSPYLSFLYGSLSYLRGSELNTSSSVKATTSLSYLRGSELTAQLLHIDCRFSKLPTRQWTSIINESCSFELSKLPTRQWTL